MFVSTNVNEASVRMGETPVLAVEFDYDEVKELKEALKLGIINQSFKRLDAIHLITMITNFLTHLKD